MDPLILNLDPRWSVFNTTPRPLNPPGGRDSKFGLDFVEKTNIFASTGIQTLDFPACTPVAIPTGLSRLLTKNVEEIFTLLKCYAA